MPREGWAYQELEARLSLVLDCVRDLPNEVTQRSKIPLRVRIAAHGTTKSRGRYDRLIRNWYFTTDEPCSPGANLWSAFGFNEIEHGLAGVLIYPYEQTIVSIDVTTPDTSLSASRPRLKLVGEHDYAIYEHLPFLRTVRDVGLVLSIFDDRGSRRHGVETDARVKA